MVLIPYLSSHCFLLSFLLFHFMALLSHLLACFCNHDITMDIMMDDGWREGQAGRAQGAELYQQKPDRI